MGSLLSLPPTVTEVSGDLPAVTVCNRHARAKVFLQGAHVASFRPVGQGELLWMSVRSLFAPGKPIRGGIPVCFPWFGMHAGRPELPAHGIARLLPWTLTGAEDLPDGSTRLVLGLQSSVETAASWPQSFALTYSVSVGAALNVALEVRNTGAQPLVFEEALHTYLDVADVRRVGVEGLAGARYLDKVDGGIEKTQTGTLTFTAETDRVFPGTTGTCRVDDPVLGRRIVVAKTGSATTVIWNPWIAKAARMPDFGDEEWPGMLCIEAANAAADHLTLAPGQTQVMAQTISVG